MLNFFENFKGGQTAGLTAKKITGGKIKAVIALDPGK